ncbi:hypothetical protein CTheo_6087 [Ceratobasidium theobromae]|uniref:DUF6534 domain-containing protein n=1 Tax=Ceratobasidium theobromae TaxID=1582974 RepID=A0A5N5QG16_9AGAM|nr:hypothetical protein CTheo_6087 [Ceratobasidium theobromae]
MLTLLLKVTYLFTIDTLNSAFDIGMVWRYSITLFGDMEGLTHSHWFLNVEPLMTVMISSTTQGFFAWRVSKLTGQAWAGWLIGISAFVQFVAGLVLSIGLFIVKDFARFQELKTPVTLWLVLSALTDVVITSVLSWYLHTHRTGFSQTDDIITRLVRLTVQTGLITTIWATTDLILFLSLPNNMHLLFQLPLCKLYTNSLMSTLNSRAGWGGSFSSSDKNDPASRSGGGTGQNRTGASVWRPDQSKSQTTAIQVMTTATIHRDDGFELEEYDGKGPSPDDIEILANSRTGTTVQLPAASGATLDDVSLHSTRASIDAK